MVLISFDVSIFTRTIEAVVCVCIHMRALARVCIRMKKGPPSFPSPCFPFLREMGAAEAQPKVMVGRNSALVLLFFAAPSSTAG